MLHNEARELLVKGYEKTHDAESIAEAYGVSKPTVYRLARQKRETGSVKLRTSQRGRKPVLTMQEKEAICQRIEESPDITIHELQEELGLTASYSTVQRAIVSMGYRFKKKSLHATERHRSRCGRKTEPMERGNNN